MSSSLAGPAMAFLLGGDRGEDVSRGNGFGHQRRDAAERRLLRGNLLQLRARRGVRDCHGDELGERADARLGVCGQRLRSRGADGHDPPEPSADQDRNPDRRANPYGADLLGHRAAGIAVVVDAGRLLRAEHAADDVVPFHRYPGARRQRLPPQVVGPDHRRGLIPLVDDQVSTVEVQEPGGFLGHRREDLRGRGLAGDQRRHPPQRGLLVGQHAPCLF
jgi:hypothetical protein